MLIIQVSLVKGLTNRLIGVAAALVIHPVRHSASLDELVNAKTLVASAQTACAGSSAKTAAPS